ncbi:MAG TPA: hypothetical protein VNY84_05865, partial [Acidimicrobiales bacterium]|nr:hypothetical protein [Acidimicrobiales bacterium]
MRRSGWPAGTAALVVGGATPTLSAAAVPADDLSLAAFSASIELVLVMLYSTLTHNLTGDAALSTYRTFAADHQGHADAWNQVAGAKAVHQPNPKLAQVLGQTLGGTVDRTTLLTLAYGVENKAAAT